MVQHTILVFQPGIKYSLEIKKIPSYSVGNSTPKVTELKPCNFSVFASLVRASQLRDPTGASTLPSHVGHKRPIGSLPRGLWVAGGQEFEMASTLALSERILSSSSSSSSSSASSLVSSSCRSNIRVTQLCHEQGTPSHVYDVYESSLLGVGDENEIAGGGEKNVAEDGEMDGRE